MEKLFEVLFMIVIVLCCSSQLFPVNPCALADKKCPNCKGSGWDKGTRCVCTED